MTLTFFGTDHDLTNVPDSILNLIFLYFDLKTIVSAQLVCKRFYNIISGNEVIWGTIFVAEFGSSYWGEELDPHPYVPEQIQHPTESWSQIFRIELLASFQNSKQRSQIGPDRSIPFSELCRMYYQIKKKWNVQKDWGVLLCGSAEKDTSAVFQDILNFFRTNSIATHVINELSNVHLIDGQHFTILKIGQARRWYPTYRDSNFNQLFPWFVFRISDLISKDKRDNVYKELHGTLGEAKKSLQTCAAISIYMDLNPDDIPTNFLIPNVLSFLKIFPVKLAPGFHCPYYAGPVTILLNFFFPSETVYKAYQTKRPDFGCAFPSNDNSNFPKCPERLIRNVGSINWLSKQPSSAPYWNMESGSILCALMENPPPLRDVFNLLK